MRLLQLPWINSFSPVEFFGSSVPPYAVLSHTWEEEEVTIKDIANGTGQSLKGYSKLTFCAKQAAMDGLQFFWVDTCCIDKGSSAELTEAINSMFSWFQRAEKCYVYLSDISLQSSVVDEPLSQQKLQELRKCRWFTRGWTLQELLAPRSVEFFSREGFRIGDKYSLLQEIHEITGIPTRAIEGADLSEFSVEDRMSWASHRETTRLEDQAYCLLGIFDVNMPMLYGEGERAMTRLRREISQSLEKDRPSGVSSERHKHARQHEKQSPIVLTPELELDASIGHTPSQQQESGQEDTPEELSWPSYYRRLIDDGFRVLTLDPGEAGSIVKGRVQTFSLSSTPTYNALSYVWGQEPPIHPILVNDELTLIRPNLFHALQRIRALQPAGVQMRIWIDSLCINQRDDLEKNTQVMRMAQIYNKAEGVFIWLGEEDLTSKLALELVTQIYEQNFQWSGPWWENAGFAALSELLERPWFRRGWVLQEAAFSTNSMIQCGDRQVYMDHFGMAMDSIRARIGSEPIALGFERNKQRMGTLANFLDSPAVRMLDMIEGAFTKSEEGSIVDHMMSLETLVHLGTFSETSNERDAIYALLNVAKDTTTLSQSDQSPTLLPDYRKSIMDVYVDFVMHCCLRSESLDIIVRPWAPSPSSLRYVLGKSGQPGPTAQDLPSWIMARDKLPYGDPALRSKHRLHGNPLVGTNQKRVYNAHNSSKPSLTLGSNGIRNGSLHIKGVFLAEVTHASSRMAEAVITRECLGLLGTISRKPHSRHINLPDSIWRTLCANRDDRGDAAPRAYRVAMLDLLHIHFGSTATDTSTNLLEHMSSIDIEELLEIGIPEHVKKYLVVVRDVIWNRRTFQARSSGLVGLIPQSARVGDHVCILYGCSVPVVLRKHHGSDGEGYWQLVGDAYAHGYMEGDTFRQNSHETIRKNEMEFELR